jgi:HAE1 family hydrophobic/amphiphilic exporter-1
MSFKLSEWSVDRPVSTIVGVLLVAVFGVVALINLPVQMKPTVDRPVIRIYTFYPGAAPPEVEEQITDKLEEKMNSVEGLEKLSSVSSETFSTIDMEFAWGTSIAAHFVAVLQKSNMVGDLPADADRPLIDLVSSADEDRIMWIPMTSKTLSAEEMSHFANKEIKDSLERVEGVGDVGAFGKREREISVFLDPEAMAARGVGVATVRQAILSENQNSRGGYIDEGKTRYNIRTVGQFKTVAEMGHMVVTRNESGTVYLRDIARIEDTYERVQSIVRNMGEPTIALGVARKIGANVVEVSKRVRAEVKQLNERFAHIVYKGRQADIKLTIVYDEADYIHESVSFVFDNLYMGAFLAAAVLIFFLKSWRATFIVALVIPICFISIFIFLQMFGRTLNIISLAGIAFAVGMTVDNAIVVIDNVYRHMEMGKSRRQATLDGMTEVWGAVLASTLTTLAVFLPVLYVSDEAGELFKDIALAISCSVAMSLLVAITVTPMMSSRMLKLEQQEGVWSAIAGKLFFLSDVLGKITAAFFIFCGDLVTGKYLEKMSAFWARWASGFVLKSLIVAAIAVFSVQIAFSYMPALEYLPTGNRNMILVIYKVHAGTNIQKASDISLGMEHKIMRLLFDPQKGDTPDNKIVNHMFSVVDARFRIIGVIVKDQYAVLPTSQLPLKQNPMSGKPFPSAIDYMSFAITGACYGTPGTEYAFAVKPGLFGRTLAKNFEIQVRGPDIARLDEIATQIQTQVQELGKKVGFAQIIKDFETGLPEIHIAVDREKAADLGLKVSEVAEVVETMVAGRKTGTLREGTEEIDIVVKAEESFLANVEALKQAEFIIPGREKTRLETVARIYTTTGPTQIFHRERKRAITVSVYLPDEKPLEEAIQQVKQEVLAAIRPTLSADYHIEVAGTASDLERTQKAFFWSFMLALVVTYLLMTSLFESFLYPFIIMMSVPLAVSGSVVAVYWNNVPMDMLTVLGFIILCGLVVNNAILLVHQALNFQREGMPPQEAIRQSVRTRLRPVFMSTLTTILGMLPMCIKGTPGSELYSGLATAIVGGLVFSTIFTLILVPALMSLWIDSKDAAKRLWQGERVGVPNN